ncbi:MAG: fumarylacetoacetate hydrolase family protein [Breznakibacter sp.]|nr:fumarylacetoacetate hydrolase family protein [Breznakibacter sp.]
MKFICIGRNYRDHALELNNQVPSEPVIFMKPDTALLRGNSPFYIPQFSNEVHHEVEILVRICKVGRSIEERFAHRYYDEIGIGIDFTARDLQDELKKKGLPWEKAKAFDSSAYVSEFFPKSKYCDLANLNFGLKINGETKQSGNTSEMIFTIDQIISYVSRFFTLKIGDIIFTGTPAGVGRVNANDVLELFIEEESMAICKIK